ncbi:MAG: twin-arginine translocation signal domain-containing protein [Gemmatimonadetes bacterium]|nr:twin-arginine translocation signal domain-containing protein [Gemmatimonadota bacterium]
MAESRRGFLKQSVATVAAAAVAAGSYKQKKQPTNIYV